MADNSEAVLMDGARRLAASIENVLAPLAGTASVAFRERRTPEALGTLPGPIASLGFSLNKGVCGPGVLVLPGAAALQLARMLLAEDPATVPETPGEAETDAFGELANQVAGSVAAALAGMAGTPVGFEAPRAAWLPDGGGGLLAPSEALVLALQVQAGPVGAEAVLMLPPAALATPAAKAQVPAAPLPTLADPPAPRNGNGIEMLLDISLPVAVELGRTRMMIRDILHLAPGSVLELDKLAGDPVEIMINGKSIARGEVVVIDENFGVRLTSIVTPSERVMNLR